MIIKLNKKLIIIIGLIILSTILIVFISFKIYCDSREKTLYLSNVVENESYEIYRRPSNENPFPNPYSFQDFEQLDNSTLAITKKFSKPEEVILAYWGILKEASNMIGYSGGCGSIGEGVSPYPYAYELLTEEMKEKMTLEQYIDSFKGIGYITLLKVLPAYSSEDSAFMIEIETIQGEKQSSDVAQSLGGRFTYYYGIMTSKKIGDSYEISEINLIPEDFLCAPEHSWFYIADAVVQIVYGDNLKIIDKIQKTEEDGYMTYIYASGNGNEYRFDFVRLTNGYDVLLHENIYEDGEWKEINLDTKDWKMKIEM